MMKSLIKGFNLLIAGTATMMISLAFELISHLAVACSYCDGTGFAIAAAIYNVTAFICILACFALGCVAVLHFFVSIASRNATCTVANMILLGTTVLMTKGDMFIFIMRGGAL